MVDKETEKRLEQLRKLAVDLGDLIQELGGDTLAIRSRRPAKRVDFAHARKSAGLTQEQLAERMCVSRETVGRWEAGNYTPSPYLWPKLAKVLEVSRERLAEMLAQEKESEVRMSSH